MSNDKINKLYNNYTRALALASIILAQDVEEDRELSITIVQDGFGVFDVDNEEQREVAEKVAALCHPNITAHTLAHVIVSAVERVIYDRQYQH